MPPMPALLLTALALAALYFCRLCACFAANLGAAKRSGFPCIVLPWDKFNLVWLIAGNACHPLLDRLPAAWTRPWLPYLKLEWIYETKYALFARLRCDAVLFVAPGGNHLYLADPAAITDVTARRNDFQKPLERYRDVNLYGDNVVVSEGSVWRRHRKITAPSFSEKNNRIVWEESLRQADALLVHWTGAAGSSGSLHHLEADMMSLSLHIISKAGFGVRVLWPHEESAQPDGDEIGRFASTTPPPGHTMSYKEAMGKLMKNVIWIPILPKWLREMLPFEGPRIASQAYDEWGLYMKELYEMKKAHMREGKKTEGLDLLGAVMRGAGINERTLNGPEPPKQQLSDAEILGNAFVFMLAGHETTANAMHFSLVLLALNPGSQRRLQNELTDIFGHRPASSWDFDHDLPKIMGGMPAAVLYEAMRLVPAVTGIPKQTMKDSPQPLNVNGRTYTVPAECIISLNVPATHHNPRYWPARPDISALPPGDELDQFKPERWLIGDGNRPARAADGGELESGDKSQSFDTAPTLFKPASGVFLPFSEGHRSCMGRRFAQVECIGIVAAILHQHSVELAVDEFATDDEIERLPEGGPERKEVWEKAAGKAVGILTKGMGSIITLQMRNGHVPLRIVKRGEERFAFG